MSMLELTLTSKYPARSRAPMVISREPIKKRAVANAMALYGTLGGLFLNCGIQNIGNVNISIPVN